MKNTFIFKAKRQLQDLSFNFNVPKFHWFLSFLMLFIGWTPMFGQKCYPDKDSLFLYYVNVKLPSAPNDMDKAKLLELLKNSNNNDRSLTELADAIVKVKKSFPTSKTDFLQRSVSIYAKSDLLEKQLSAYGDLFSLVEMLCFPESPLLYQPNDYTIEPFRKSHLDLIHAKEAWDVTQGDSRIIIGISDTHIDHGHEDLAGKIVFNLSPNTDPTAGDSWHGVAVSGCAAANTDNSIGLSSIGFNSSLGFISYNEGSGGVLLMAQSPGVRVINCSWGYCGFSATENALYQSIQNVHNVVVTAGAGNRADIHCGENGLIYPATYESVISVTSVGHQYDIGTLTFIDGQNRQFNWKDCYLAEADKPSTHHHNNTAVDICAPGFNVASTFSGGNYANNSYSGAWGTSFAAPQVAGVCALVASVDPCLTAQQIRNIVIQTADPSIYQISVNQPVIGLLGSGRLDAYQAVKRAFDLGSIFVQNRTYNGTATEDAHILLKAGFNVTNNQAFGLVTINPNSDVTFRATREIVLSQGFTVSNNANFQAEIYVSPCF